MSDNYIWQPVGPTEYVCQCPDCGVPGARRRQIYVNTWVENYIVGICDPDNGDDNRHVVLPDDLRLCRRVPSGAGVPAQEADASEQLLPCPFCGGTAHLLSYSLSAMAHCADCGASVAWQRGADAESAAIAGWNRRVPVDVPAPPQQEADRE